MNLVELDIADDGRRVPVAVGDTVRVRLPESGAAGHGWRVEVVGPADLADDRVELPSGPLAGAALVRLIGLSVSDAGQIELRARRRPPGNGDSVDEYRIELEVA